MSELATKNTMGKTRKVNDPYEVYVAGDVWEWRVLKHYQSPAKEATNAYARVFAAVRGSGTFGSYDLGDTYLKDIVGYGERIADEDLAAHLAANPWREY